MKFDEFRKRYPYVAFAVVVLIVVVVVTMITSFARTESNSGRIDRLGDVQQQLVRDRKLNNARFARSDRLLCKEIEKLKARARADAVENYRNLDRNLRLLGVKKTREIVKLTNEAYRKDLRETKPLDCKTIPPPDK